MKKLSRALIFVAITVGCSAQALQMEDIDIGSFVDLRAGTRLQEDPFEKDLSLAEIRWQVSAEIILDDIFESMTLFAKTDFIYDEIEENRQLDLEAAESWIDLRELNLSFAPSDFADIKVGRQVLTWGTGDFLYLNDLFPKDYNFFAGRDLEYVKAPSDALKVSFYSTWTNLDVIYIPKFDPDRLIDGRRLSYVNTRTGQRVGRNQIIQFEDKKGYFSDDEVALRVYGRLKEVDWAIYQYNGFWKSPLGISGVTQKAVFNLLSVYGFSLRRSLFGGIANTEFAYYDSKEDRAGNNDLVPNSEVRFLLGFEREIAKEFTGGFQYYFTSLLKYDEFRNSLGLSVVDPGEKNHLVTLRLTKKFWSQTLHISWFNAFSLTNKDWFSRLISHYLIDDHWSFDLGLHIFNGRSETFFGALQANSNAHLALRYGF